MLINSILSSHKIIKLTALYSLSLSQLFKASYSTVANLEGHKNTFYKKKLSRWKLVVFFFFKYLNEWN